MNPFDQQKAIPGIKNVLTIGSGKGGVGKSTVTVNLAMALKKTGAKVGILDADIYGPSLPRLLGCINQKPTVDEENKIIPLERYGIKIMSMGFLAPEESAIVWRGPMLFKAMDQFFRDVKWGELDYLLIDLPPGTGDVALTIAQKVPVAGAIVVCTPQNLALVDAKKAIDMFNRINVPILGAIENMSGLSIEGQDELIPLFPKGELDPYLDSKGIEKLGVLPFAPSLGISAEAGIPMAESHPTSHVVTIFQEICKKIEAHI